MYFKQLISIKFGARTLEQTFLLFTHFLEHRHSFVEIGDG